MKNCAQASAKGGIIQKFEFRHLIFDLSNSQFHYFFKLILAQWREAY